MENYKEISRCLCCESNRLQTIFDLGNQSPVNNYNVAEKYPLKLKVCLQCTHAQLSHSVSPLILFNDYPYMSGVSKTMLEHYKWFAEKFSKPNASVFEIACNDGCQLDEFKKLGNDTYGIDPAENLIEATKLKGHNVVCDFFPNNSEEKFDIVIAQNVLAHNDNPFEFLQGCLKIMESDSRLYIQTSQANMIKNYQFDTIYHEHISFFNKNSIRELFYRSRLEIVDYYFLNDIHGGSDLYVLKKLSDIPIEEYLEFASRSYDFAKEFKMIIDELQKKNKIVCYGGAAKMINLIRFTKINPDHIIDDTPTKIGKTIEGIVVQKNSYLAELNDGTYIIPVWNFYEEIKLKVETDYPNKFKFIKYIPQIIIE